LNEQVNKLKVVQRGPHSYQQRYASPPLTRAQTTPNHIQFVFYHNINLKENGFFRARAEKGIA